MVLSNKPTKKVSNMNVFRYDIDQQIFYTATERNGGSSKLKWTQLSEQINLTDVKFGVCQHPFDPEKISFRRKTFTPYTDEDYGMAIKGTVLTHHEYNHLMPRMKHNPTIQNLFFRYGSKLWQSYPSLVKKLQNNGEWDSIRRDPEYGNTSQFESYRKFPTWEEENKKFHYQPMGVKAFRFSNHDDKLGIIFNEGATIKTWHEHHDTISNDWRGVVQARVSRQSSSAAA
jgi:hypothetical protein